MPTRRGNPARYFVQLDNQQMFRLSAARWHTWIAAGLLILIGGRVAKPAKAGVVWLQDGELHVPPEPVWPWINLSCRLIEQRMVPKLEPIELQLAIQREYGGRD